MTTEKGFFDNYVEFVSEVTSPESKDFGAFIARLTELHEQGLDIQRLMTGGAGLSSEGGEFNEIVKKMVFQGKEFNEDNRFHMKRELGDIIWYWVQACVALGYKPVDVIAENVDKLEARYPGGKFDVFKSENRADGDL